MLTKWAGYLRQKVPCPLFVCVFAACLASPAVPCAQGVDNNHRAQVHLSLPMLMRKALIGLRSMDGVNGASVFVSAVHAVYWQDT